MIPRGANPWARPGELNLLQDNMALKKFQAPRSLALSELASCLGGREDGAEVRGEGLAAREARWFRWRLPTPWQTDTDEVVLATVSC
jgi:hypothetical protein